MNKFYDYSENYLQINFAKELKIKNRDYKDMIEKSGKVSDEKKEEYKKIRQESVTNLN